MTKMRHGGGASEEQLKIQHFHHAHFTSLIHKSEGGQAVSIAGTSRYFTHEGTVNIHMENQTSIKSPYLPFTAINYDAYINFILFIHQENT